MTDAGLAAFYRRYRFDDLPEFVARDVVINGPDHGLDTFAEALRVAVRGFPDFRWQLRHLMVDPPWIAVHLADTGTHRGIFLDVPATGRQHPGVRLLSGRRRVDHRGVGHGLRRPPPAPARVACGTCGCVPSRSSTPTTWNA